MDADMDVDMLNVYTEGNVKIFKNFDDSMLNSPTVSKTVSRIKSHDRSSLSFSPNVNKSEKFSERTDKNNVLLQYGSAKSTKSKKPAKWSSTISINHLSEKTSLLECYKYMYQLPYDITTALSSAIDDLSSFVSDHSSADSMHWAEVDCVESEEPIYVYGKIFSNDDGKLDLSSIMLQGSRKISKGNTVQLDIGCLENYSFFPGQFVAFRGINPDGKKFVPDKICFPQLPPQLDVTFEPNVDSVSVMIASGPFTTKDNLEYQPLKDLMGYVVDHEPDILILTGPLLPVKHDLISKNLVLNTFEELFKIIMKEHIFDRLANCRTKVLVVSSTKDVFHHPIYPCPPYSNIKLNFPDKIKFVADPSLVRIGGIVFGLTSTDVLFDMCKVEISNSGTDRMSRLLEHLFHQRNFYPLYPPNEQFNIDYTQFYEYGMMPVRPHVLITPSNLKYFIKEVSDVVCVNPGTLSKGEAGGTFVQMQIELSQLASRSCKFSDCLSVEVLKV